MSKPIQKRIYTILGLLALLYTMFGCILSTTTTDYVVPLMSDIKYNSWENPAYIGFIMILSGIPLFLLFLFLERRSKK